MTAPTATLNCVLHTQSSDLSALVGVQLVAVSRLEPRGSASKAGALPSAPCCLLPWKVLEEAGGSKHRGGVFRLPDMLTAGGALIDLFVCPCCVPLTFFWPLDRLCPGQHETFPWGTCGCRRPVPTPESVGTTVLLFPLVVVMWRSYLLPNWERRLEENISAAGP